MTSYIGIARTQSYMQTPGTINRVNCLWCIYVRYSGFLVIRKDCQWF